MTSSTEPDIHERIALSSEEDQATAQVTCIENLVKFGHVVFGHPFVKPFALCYRSVVCLSCLSDLSVTLVYCGQTVGRIKMKLGMQVSLGPGHIVLGGDPAPLP